MGPEQALVMEHEVDTLLSKEAIEHVPPLSRYSRLYSQYFIVLKKDGGVMSYLRVVLDDPLSHVAEVQDAGTQKGRVSNQV